MYEIGNAGGANGFRFGMTSGTMGFLLGNTSGYTESPCGGKINDGVWHYIAGVFDRTGGAFNCYVNGALSGSISIPAYPGANDNVPTIGVVCCTNLFVGQADEISAYLSNLSASDIKALYAEGKPRHEDIAKTTDSTKQD